MVVGRGWLRLSRLVSTGNGSGGQEGTHLMPWGVVFSENLDAPAGGEIDFCVTSSSTDRDTSTDLNGTAATASITIGGSTCYEVGSDESDETSFGRKGEHDLIMRVLKELARFCDFC